MPTVIDSLIVTLGLDSKNLEAKSGSAGKTLKGLEQQGAKTEVSVKKIGVTSKESAGGVDTLAKSLGSFLALIGGTMALKSFISQQVESNAALARFSQNLGMSVSDVSAWGNAVEEMGGSAKGLQGTMDMLSKSQTEWALTGQSSLTPYLSALSVSLMGVGKEARPVNEILLDLADRFAGMDRTQANNMGRMMGLDQDTLNLLLQGRQEVELTIKRQKEYNAVNKEQAAEAVKLQRSIVDLKQGFNALGRDLLQQASPAIEKVLAGLSELGGWVRANKEFVADFLTVMAVGLGAIALATLPITGTVAAITALGAAIALLYQDYQTWKRGGDSFVDWGVWKDRIDAVTGAIQKLRDGMGDLESKIDRVLKKSSGYKAFDAWFTSKDDAKAVSKHASAMGSAFAADFGISSSSRSGKLSLEQAIAKVEGFNAKGSKPNRPQRNHNPGDIEYGDFAKAHGATGTDGRFAIFPNDNSGFAALTALLKTQGYSSLSVEQAIGKFAPPSENDTAKYVKDVTRSTGLKSTDLLSGIQGASSNVAAAVPQRFLGTMGGGDNSTSVQTGDINIYTQATDANGIARDMGKGMDYLFPSHANSGLF